LKIEGSLKIDFAAIMERMRRLRVQIARNDSVERFFCFFDRSLSFHIQKLDFISSNMFLGSDIQKFWALMFTLEKLLLLVCTLNSAKIKQLVTQIFSD
jgi:hypothetical protein